MSGLDPKFDRRMLVSVARGIHPADMVIRNGQWVCVQSGEIIPNTDIAIIDQRIAYVGPDASHTIGTNTQIINAAGRYLTPGLLDGHMHVESGMLTITEFVRAVIPHGTTGMFIDPHEIANVFGLKGVRLMVDEATVQPIHVWVQVPSCIPSAPGLETPGASLGLDEISEAMSWEGIIGLGEMMDFRGVIRGDEKIHAELAITRQAGKIIGGHYASPDLGIPFHAYAAGGAADDHEGTSMEDALARVRQGMRAMLRHGSAWQDVKQGIRAITELGLDPRMFILCTDDSHSQTLVHEGHINRAIHEAIKYGVSPINAIQMATINPAEYFRVSEDVGMIAPGRFADILILEDLRNIRPEIVIARGTVVAEGGKIQIDLPGYLYPDWVKNSIHLNRLLTSNDFRLTLTQDILPDASKVLVHVIGVIENQAPTRHIKLELPIQDGLIRIDKSLDIALAAVVERHGKDNHVQIGLVQGFGFDKPCGIGSTVAHDSHQMILVGTDEADMATAANELVKMCGGQVVICQGKVVGKVALPVAGLMSDQKAETVARDANSVLDGFKTCGCQLNNPNMQLSLLTLAVIPELRITDLGLVDTINFKFLPVIESTKVG